MIFLEEHARLLVVLHAIVGAAGVAAATHVAIWARPGRRAERLRGTRWLAAASLVLFAAGFVLGNLVYPTYKVRVRGEYLDSPAAVAADARVRLEARARILGDAAAAARPSGAAHTDLTGLARLFDVKEHAAALALPLVIVACALAWRTDPRRDGPIPDRLLFASALAAAACAWAAAVIGLVVATYRSAGAFL